MAPSMPRERSRAMIGDEPIARLIQRRAIWAACLVMCALPGLAQVQIGDELKMNLNGILSGGYTGDYGSLIQSTHGLTFGGNADLSGSYYDPNFISFHLQPFYDQSRTNSNYQSISASRGLSSSAAFFTGSNFPGTMSFNKTYNSDGTFALPGAPDFTTHGNSQTFSLGWGVRIPDYPNLAFMFQRGSNNYSLYGSNDEGQSHFDTFSVTATHVLAGFHLSAGYHLTKVNTQVPGFFAGSVPEKSDTNSNSFNFGVGHSLPMKGAFSAGASHSSTNSEFNAGQFNGDIDSVNGGLSFSPVSNLSFGSNAQYINNLAGTLYQSIINTGSGILPTNVQQSSHSLDINNYVNYQLPALHLTFMGMLDHREQALFGTSLTADSYTATVGYSNMFFGGFLNALVGVIENKIDTSHQSNTGLISTLNYSHRVENWNVSGSFNYARNQQTLLVAYTTSSYGYTANIGRRLGGFSHLMLTAGGTKSELTGYTGSSTFAQNYSASLSFKLFSVNGAYSKSNGNALLTGAGLTPTPVPVPVITPASLVMYGGKAYSFGAATSPIRGLSISASYAKALSDTASEFTSSKNRMENLTTRIQYQFRQMSFQAGYTRLIQGFSITGGPPVTVGSFYVGVSRWFDFF